MRILITVALVVCFAATAMALKSKIKCGLHEEFSECYTSCPKTCANYDHPCQTIRTPALKGAKLCKTGCYCKLGYVRQVNDGPCISIRKCPKNSQKGDSLGEQRPEYFTSETRPTSSEEINPHGEVDENNKPAFHQTIIIGGQNNNNQNEDGYHTVEQKPVINNHGGNSHEQQDGRPNKPHPQPYPQSRPPPQQPAHPKPYPQPHPQPQQPSHPKPYPQPHPQPQQPSHPKPYPHPHPYPQPQPYPRPQQPSHPKPSIRPLPSHPTNSGSDESYEWHSHPITHRPTTHTPQPVLIHSEVLQTPATSRPPPRPHYHGPHDAGELLPVLSGSDESGSIESIKEQIFAIGGQENNNVNILSKEPHKHAQAPHRK